MPQVIALKTHCHTWRSDFTKWLDAELSKHDIGLVDMPWSEFSYVKDDPDHFTVKGLEQFTTRLAYRLRRKLREKRVAIVSDSTIDYLPGGSDYVADKLLRYKIHASVDAVCGSGFVAPKKFASRLSAAGECDIILIIGGWNDAHHCREKVAAEIAKVAMLKNDRSV